MATIGDRIREQREKRGWTQEKLAEEAQLSKSFLSDVENNKRDISTTNALKIANALGCSLQYLVSGETSKRDDEREPIQIPTELSKAAEELKLSYSDTLTLLETHKSIVARRSNKVTKAPTVEEWKELYEAIKRVYPTDGAEAQK